MCLKYSTIVSKPLNSWIAENWKVVIESGRKSSGENVACWKILAKTIRSKQRHILFWPLRRRIKCNKKKLALFWDINGNEKIYKMVRTFAFGYYLGTYLGGKCGWKMVEVREGFIGSPADSSEFGRVAYRNERALKIQGPMTINFFLGSRIKFFCVMENFHGDR